MKLSRRQLVIQQQKSANKEEIRAKDGKYRNRHEAAGEDVYWGGNAVFRYLPYLPQEKKNLMKSNFSSGCHLWVTSLVKA